MPCNAVRVVTMELKAANAELLADALQACGLQYHEGAVERIIKAGLVAVPVGQEHKVVEVRRAYAELVVRTAARRLGFQVRDRQGSREARVLVVSRR